MDNFTEIVSKYIGRDVDLDATMESQGLDSLDTVELVMELEAAYDISISDDVASEFENFRDMYDHIHSLGLIRDLKWRMGQTLVCRSDGLPYKVTKITNDGLELTRIVQVKSDAFGEWSDGTE